ncbi:MAG: SRPBCC domain-containing protein [Bacteroidota bacterium]
MKTANQQFTITRTFEAPMELVFQAFATEAALAEWWGPVAAPIDVISLDFRPGGKFHYRMNGAQVHYGIFRYTEITRPDTITWINSFADEKGEIIKPPFEGLDIPREILNKITLTEVNGITTLKLVSEPNNASENEIDTFYAITDSMQKGFGGTLDQLEKYLQKMQ